MLTSHNWQLYITILKSYRLEGLTFQKSIFSQFVLKNKTTTFVFHSKRHIKTGYIFLIYNYK